MEAGRDAGGRGCLGGAAAAQLHGQPTEDPHLAQPQPRTQRHPSSFHAPHQAARRTFVISWSTTSGEEQPTRE
jgi:hypothetical protein